MCILPFNSIFKSLSQPPKAISFWEPGCVFIQASSLFKFNFDPQILRQNKIIYLCVSICIFVCRTGEVLLPFLSLIKMAGVIRIIGALAIFIPPAYFIFHWSSKKLKINQDFLQYYFDNMVHRSNRADEAVILRSQKQKLIVCRI